MAWRPTATAGLVGGLACAAIGAVAAWRLSPLDTAGSAILAGAMAAVAIEDWRRLRLPDPLLAATGLAGLAMAGLQADRDGAEPLAAIGWAAMAAFLCGAVFLALREGYHRMRGQDGLGLGDVKLAAAGGAWIGWQGMSWAVVAAAIAALAYVGLHGLRGEKWPAAKRIPLALFLAPAIWAVWYGLSYTALPV
jgi:leader peptidase (prepilin peptidase)/N-methyltransferase